MTNTYQLVPFSAEPMSYSVQVKVERLQNKLVFIFELTDPKNEIVWPQENEIKRQDFLWESTCFEAFIGSNDQANYFELNLSPTRAWNLYRFTNYRTPNDMPPLAVNEPALITFEVKDRSLSAEIDLTSLKLADIEIKLGLTAVLKTTKTLHYFAIQHPVPHADFHDSMGWTIRLLPDAQIPESNVDKKAENP